MKTPPARRLISAHVRAIRAAGGHAVSSHAICKAIGAGQLPAPRVCDCGRKVFGDDDLAAAVEHFGLNRPAEQRQSKTPRIWNSAGHNSHPCVRRATMILTTVAALEQSIFTLRPVAIHSAEVQL
jgi:hypothetical protein